jgi:DNA-directed RNA polymerase III subunit RPC8
MYIDSGEILRVRVETDEFYDDEPGPPPKALEGVHIMREVRRAPYTITVGCSISFVHVVLDPS